MSENYIQYKAIKTLDPNYGMVEGKLYPHNVPIIKSFWAVNPRTGQRDRVRLVKFESSIWKSEQSEKDDAKVKWDNVAIKRGNLLIPAETPQGKRLIEFLDIHPANRDTPAMDNVLKVFYRFDLAKNEEQRFAAINMEGKATGYAYNMPYEKVEMLCDYFGIGGVTEDGKRADLYNKAKQNPQEFLAAAESEKTPIIANIRKAMNKNVIAISAAKDSIRWSDGRGVLNLPIGAGKPEEAAAHFAQQILTNESVRGSYNEILGALRVFAPQALEGKMERVPEKEIADFNSLANVKTKELVKRGVELGIITISGRMGREYYFEGKSCGIGEKNTIQYFDENPEVHKKLLLQVNAKSSN